jgi:hypothetical protein
MKTMLIAGLAAVAVGCGGGGGGSDETMAASDWTAKVEQMCRKQNAAGEAKVAELQKQSKSQEDYAAKVLEYGADSTKPLIDKVADMPAPKGKEKQADDFVASMNRLLPMIDDLAGAVRDNDEKKGRGIISDMQAETAKARAAARELGIDACIPNNGVS